MVSSRAAPDGTTGGTTAAAGGDGPSTDRGPVTVGVLLAHAPEGDPADLRSFAERMARDAIAELESATSVDWQFFVEDPIRLSSSDARHPSEFLDEATHRMVEGSYDLTVVVTDVALVSSRQRFVPGLASPLARIAVLSTRELRTGVREETRRPLDAPAVRWNGATLLCHLVGHVLGARHADADGGVMTPFRFDPDRRRVPPFEADVESYLHGITASIPQAEVPNRGRLRRLAFYATSAVRNGREILRTLVDSRAPFLPLSLPKLTTAAVAPTLIIVFSAEAWDVGYNMSDATAGAFAVVSILAASVYLLFAQNLSFPRKHHRAVTEHTALVNVTILLILVVMMVGLFALVGLIILVIELFVFPPNLMSNWPSLEDPAIGLHELLRIGTFISTVGVLSGALAGGLESRAIVRHLALFDDRP